MGIRDYAGTLLRSNLLSALKVKARVTEKLELDSVGLVCRFCRIDLTEEKSEQGSEGRLPLNQNRRVPDIVKN